MKTIAVIESKVLYIKSTTCGTFYILSPIADALKKVRVFGTQYNNIPEIQSDGSAGSSSTCPTVKVLRHGMLIYPGVTGKVIHEAQPESKKVIRIRVSKCEGFERLVHGEYHFSIC